MEKFCEKQINRLISQRSNIPLPDKKMKNNFYIVPKSLRIESADSSSFGTIFQRRSLAQ